MAVLTDPFWTHAKFPSPSDKELAKRGIESFVESARDVDSSEEENPHPLVDFADQMVADTDGAALLNAVFGNSPFLTQCILRDPSWFRRLIDVGSDTASFEIIDAIKNLKSEDLDEATAMRELRIAKRRIALAIALADIGRLWDWPRVTETLSEFADAAISLACANVLRRCAARGGLRLKSNQNPEAGSGFFVLAMGKLGACELNYSSDIDLICLFDSEQADTDDIDELQHHAIRMTRNLARILDERTVDGYVFRVDLRLRPDPGSTPLAISVLAAETYYESLGQNWERAAMIKARVVAGDYKCGEAFIANLRPFVWRKSLDFAAIEDIHSIKRQIHAHKGGAEVAVEDHDIKTGRGGIREIEFFAQTQQLIWGGRELDLRTRKTMDAIRVLVDIGQVEPEVADDLKDAYGFLRTLEHRLQMLNDEQTQRLPAKTEDIAALAIFLGYTGPDEFRADLVHHLQTVQHHYSELFGSAPSLAADNGISGSLSFTGAESDQDTLETLSRLGFQEPSKIDAAIRAWHHGRVRATRSTRARELLTELTPTILREIAEQFDPDAAFGRFDSFVTGLPSGVQLFSMFQAYPHILNLIAEIMGEAPRLADHLGRRPGLLDSVLSVDFYDPLEAIPELISDCQDAARDAQFLEEVLDATRQWNADKRFQVGIQMLRRVIDPGQAAMHFSNIAETVLNVLIPRVISEFEHKHGQLKGGRFCVLALGKLGSRELTPSSDLDLVFIYDCDDLGDESDGDKPLAASQYYGRLGQRIISAIMSRTAEGTLYEVDMRLRPSGNKGPISTSLEGYRKYYQESAWSWEFMTLVRGRPVFDTHDLATDVDAALESILRGKRDAEKISKDIAGMRARIEKQYSARCPWTLKHVPGGLVDVDFIAQFMVLAHAAKHQEILLRNSKHIISRADDLNLIDHDDAGVLGLAATLYQSLSTFLSLVIEGDIDESRVRSFSPVLKKYLTEISGTENFEELEKQLMETQTQARHIFEKIIGPIGSATPSSDDVIPLVD